MAELRVTITSFSYAGGYPEDLSGHGGFVFDCRALENPGLLEEHRLTTGKDESVRAFLEKNPDTKEFFEHAAALVDLAVRNYLKRDYNSLSVAFGCTGGQHRSVYLAESLAAHFEEAFSEVQVELNHREGF